VLSIGVAKADYYLEQVTRSLEGYYLNGEAPGCWLGRGAERLGLAGRVEHGLQVIEVGTDLTEDDLASLVAAALGL